MPVVIDDGIAQQSVEPGDSVLFVADLACLLNTSNERILENLLGVLSFPYAGREEVEKPAMVREKPLDDCVFNSRFELVCGHTYRPISLMYLPCSNRPIVGVRAALSMPISPGCATGAELVRALE